MSLLSFECRFYSASTSISISPHTLAAKQKPPTMAWKKHHDEAQLLSSDSTIWLSLDRAPQKHFFILFSFFQALPKLLLLLASSSPLIFPQIEKRKTLI
jgi:hypothetical protein